MHFINNVTWISLYEMQNRSAMIHDAIRTTQRNTNNLQVVSFFVLFLLDGAFDTWFFAIKQQWMMFSPIHKLYM